MADESSYQTYFGRLLTFAALILQANVSAAVPNNQISYLETFYNSLGGLHWSWRYPAESEHGLIWNFEQEPVDPCNDWQGLLCVPDPSNSSQEVISGIYLNYYNLSGVIPDSFGNLTSLLKLRLKGNDISGELPLSLCSLHNITDINLGENRINGTVNSCFLQEMDQLHFLILFDNELEGSLPNVSYNSQLVYFSVAENDITGSIPPSFGHLTNISQLYFASTLMTGSLNHIANLTSLRLLAISESLFSGSLPAEMSSMKELRSLYIQDNMFSSSIPVAWQALHKLKYFTAYSCSLTGSLPDALVSQWTAMEVLAIDTNYFVGMLPKTLANMNNLQQITIYSCFLTGTVSSTFASLHYLVILLLQNNLLTGNLNLAFNRTNQIYLETIDVSSNAITGILPVQAFGERLTAFSAFDTCFKGIIPDDICNSQSLTTLALDGIAAYCSKRIWPSIPHSPRYSREVTSTIPECIWKLKNITTLHLAGNGIDGYLPDLESYGNLSSLDLSFNHLYGTIPMALQQWSKLILLNLQNNRLRGTITAMGSLTYGYQPQEEATGVTLKLSNNRLSGIIPLEIEFAENINILNGNLFSCSYAHQPPANNPDNSNYVCGSNLLDISLYVFAATSFPLAFLLVFAVYALVVKLASLREIFITLTTPTKLAELHRSLLECKECKDGSSNSSYNIVFLTVLDWQIFAVKVLYWRSVTLQLRTQSSSQQQSPQQPQQQVFFLVQFLRTVYFLRRLIQFICVLIVIVALPLYGGLKTRYGSYIYQYRWLYSGALFAGYEPAIAVFLLWLVIIVVTLESLHRYIPKTVSHLINGSFDSHSQGGKSSSNNNGSSHPVDNRGTLATFGLSLFLSDRNSSNNIDSTNEQVGSGRATIAEYLRKPAVWVSLSALFLNIIVVTALKTGFIFLLTSSNTSFELKVFIEVILSALDVFYTTFIVPRVIRSLPKKKSTGRMLLKTCMLYFNSVFAPCALIAIVDTSCFNGLFVKAPNVTEAFTFTYCYILSPLGPPNCDQTATWTSTRYYTPSWIYNWSCYSTIITEYLPVFLLSYSFLAMAVPCVSLFVISRPKPWKIFEWFLPGVYFVDTVSLYGSNGLQTTEKNEVEDMNHNDQLKAEDITVTNAIHHCDLPLTRITSTTPFQQESFLVHKPDNSMIHSFDSSQQQHMSSMDISSTNDAASKATIDETRKISSKISSKQNLFFPAFILASIIHHLLVQLTFGIMSPPLAVAVMVVVCSTTLTWEVVIGRWLCHGQCNNTVHSLTSSLSTKKMLLLDRLCENVCCSPRKCTSILVFGSALFFGCALIDMAGDTQGWYDALWALISAIGAACVLWIYYNRDELLPIAQRRARRFTRRLSQLYDNQGAPVSQQQQSIDEDKPGFDGDRTISKIELLPRMSSLAVVPAQSTDVNNSILV